MIGQRVTFLVKNLPNQKKRSTFARFFDDLSRKNVKFAKRLQRKDIIFITR